MIEKVLISSNLIEYLEKGNLWDQYKKTKNYLLSWNYRQIDFKLREPKRNKIYYFRINKQYRAYCKFDWNNLNIFDINDHQN